MFLIVSDENLKEKVSLDSNYTYLTTKKNNGQTEYVFLLEDNAKMDFSVDEKFEFGLKPNPLYRFSNQLVF